MSHYDEWVQNHCHHHPLTVVAKHTHIETHIDTKE